MCTLVHWVECAIIRSLDPVLYRKIQGRESLYSGIFYALVSDSRTARIIYFCIKICSLQLLFDTVQLLFSFANSLLCTCFMLLLTKSKTIWLFHVITFELINIQIAETFLFAKRGCSFWYLNILFLVINTNCKFWNVYKYCFVKWADLYKTNLSNQDTKI